MITRAATSDVKADQLSERALKRVLWRQHEAAVRDEITRRRICKISGGGNGGVEPPDLDGLLAQFLIGYSRVVWR